MAPHQTHELRIPLAQEDILGRHVNLARYFAFINSAFQGWYNAVGTGVVTENPGFSNVMAHLSYDFLREVSYPGAVLVKLRVTSVGRASMEHAIEIHDVSDHSEAHLAGRGRAVHVWINRGSGRSEAWPAHLLAKCWLAEAAGA